MRFSLEEQTCRVVNVNPRAEKHGDENKPAADLKLRAMLPNKELKQFDKTLLDMVYQSGKQGDAFGHMAELKYPKLKLPFGWEDEVVGGTVTVHRGIHAKSNIPIKNCLVGGFQIEPLQGGSVAVTFTAKFHPENEDQIGKLSMLIGQDIVVSVESPTEKEQAKQRDLLEPKEEEKEAE